jgi:hypothetical protein
MAVARRSARICRFLCTACLASTVFLLPQDPDLWAQTVPAATTASVSSTNADAKPEPRTKSGRPGIWQRLHVPDPLASRAAREALDGAQQLLAQPACVEGLSAFRDEAGHPLEERLTALSVDYQTYLGMVYFMDGSRETRCTTGAFAFTAPGSRVVRLCVEQLKRTSQQDQMHTIANFIHEMLHTLGLGENPPTSEEITRRVIDACGPDPVLARNRRN